MRKLFVVVAVLMISCNSGSKDPENPRIAQQHWIQSEPLESLMKRISSQQQSVQRGLPGDVESGSRLDAAKMAELAMELSRSARIIPETVNLRHLSETDERAFVAEANALAQQAMELHNAAKDYQVEPMQRAMMAIQSTCLCCHSRFKELTGDLDQRASVSRR